MQVYCHFCEKYLDSKNDPEHWDEEMRCVKEIEENKARYEKYFEPDPDDWNKQAHWGDFINKRTKEIGPRPNYRRDNRR